MCLHVRRQCPVASERGCQRYARTMRFYQVILVALLGLLAGCSRHPAQVSVLNSSTVTLNNVRLSGEDWTQPLGWMLPGMSVRLALPSANDRRIWLSFDARGQKFDTRGPRHTEYFAASGKHPLLLSVGADLKVAASNH